MATKHSKTSKPDLKAALGAMRTLMEAAWIIDCQGSLARAKEQGTLPKNVCQETLMWYSSAEIVKQAGRQMGAMERLTTALGVNLNFGKGERPDDEAAAR